MRTVPTALQAHLDSGMTTTTILMRVDPLQPGYASYGVTELNRDVAYNDGTSQIVYSSAIGMTTKNRVSSSEMVVDNSEATHLVPEFNIPFSEAQLAAGILDFAWYTVYLVNFEDLTMGHVVLDHGQLGENRILAGLTFTTETTSLEKLLKQTVVEKDSITCRAIYGSQPLGTVGADIVERFPCRKTYVWVSGAVTSVGAETTRTCGASGLAQAAGYFTPGMVKWLTGANAGRQSEVESFDAGGVISLAFETMFPITVGDTFQIRTDCTKWKNGTNGCKDHWGTDWVLHYRGEPDIPVSDANAINTPGATVGAGLGG